MRSIPCILTALSCTLALPAIAQVSTNAPATEIENFELQTDVVMVKGFGDVGSVSTEGGIISVRCKESDNLAANSKLYGIAVGINLEESHGYLVVDYDEMDSLIRALDFIGKISYNVTPMQGFDASFTTRSGLRIGAHTERRQSGIQFFLQFDDTPKIPLSADQLNQFQNLVYQAKTSLDALKNKESSSP
jgi:hypothetical protein